MPVDEHLLSPEEQAQIWHDLLTGPRQRGFHPEVKSALLEGLGPDKTELAQGVLEIVETGGFSLEDYLAELHRKYGDGREGSPNE